MLIQFSHDLPSISFQPQPLVPWPSPFHLVSSSTAILVSVLGHFVRSPIPHAKHLAPLISDQSNDHGVEVEEEHKQVEAKLDERLLLMDVELPEDLRSVEQVLVLEDPVGMMLASSVLKIRQQCQYFMLACDLWVWRRTSSRSKPGEAG
jgi:hypothetical protein